MTLKHGCLALTSVFVFNLGGTPAAATTVGAARDDTKVATTRDDAEVATTRDDTKVAAARDDTKVAAARDDTKVATARDDAEVARLATATGWAGVHVHRDRRGRPIRVVTEWASFNSGVYATILRNAAHGREISKLTVHVASRSRIAQLCGGNVGGCYKGSIQTIVVPAGSKREVQHTVLHEYGHHLDRYRRGVGPELNGGRRWFKARSMWRRVRSGQYGYGNGRPWSKRIHEMWAEDYASLHLEGTACWLPLGCTTTKVRRAVLRDATGMRWRARKPRRLKRSITLSGSSSRNVRVRVRRIGGRLRVRLTPFVDVPDVGWICEIALIRDGKWLEYEAGNGSLKLERRHAVGGRYTIQFRSKASGCRADALIEVP